MIQAIATFCLPYPAGTLRQLILLTRNRLVQSCRRAAARLPIESMK